MVGGHNSTGALYVAALRRSDVFSRLIYGVVNPPPRRSAGRLTNPAPGVPAEPTECERRIVLYIGRSYGGKTDSSSFTVTPSNLDGSAWQRRNN